MSQDQYFLIESGEPLRLVREHIAERKRVQAENLAMCKELGVERFTKDSLSGALSGVVFNGTHPDGWTKPKGRHGLSFPKKGSEWAKRFAAQKGYANQSSTIFKAFNIPHSIHYNGADGSEGWMRVGSMLTECGFMWLGDDGPFAMWIPDIAAAVRIKEADGYTVKEAGWKPSIPGARLILKEEWELLVAQHELAEARKAQEGAQP